MNIKFTCTGELFRVLLISTLIFLTLKKIVLEDLIMKAEASSLYEKQGFSATQETFGFLELVKLSVGNRRKVE